MSGAGGWLYLVAGMRFAEYGAMTLAPESFPTTPCLSAFRGPGAEMERCVDDFFHVGNVKRGQVREVICDAFKAMKAAGWLPEASLVCCKQTITAVSKRQLRRLSEADEIWVCENLVVWMCQCYFAEPKTAAS